jgi:ACS family sodium-dependent inorganic phosphate cotransporter
VGAAESVVLPTLQKLLLSWVPPERKSLAVATIFSGFQTGTIAAFLVSPAVMLIGGWRGLFYVYGGVGLLWLLPWLAFAKDAPSKDQNITYLESSDSFSTSQSLLSYDKQSTWQEAVEVWKTAPWKGFFQSKGVWAMLLAHAANNWGLYNLLSWTPTFYSEQYGLDVRDSAWLSVLPSVAGAVGGLFAGSVADTIIGNLQNKTDDQITMVRKVFQGISLYGPALTLGYLASHIPEQAWVAQFLLMGTVGLQAFHAAGYGAANQEKAGERWAGLMYSVTSLPGVMVGSLGVYTTGQILDLTHQDWSIVFGINALINVLGASAFVLLYNSKREFD